MIVIFLWLSCQSPARKAPADEPEEGCPTFALPSWPSCLQTVEEDLDAYGERFEVTRTIYDDHGNPLSMDAQTTEDTDDWIWCAYTWTGRDQPLTEACNGRSEYTYQWDYDEAGDPVSKAYDGGNDGEFDKIWSFDVDDRGRVTSEAVDEDLDGEPDLLVAYLWDEQDRLTWESWDYQADGTLNFIRSSEYEGDVLVRQAEDSDGDGLEDRVTTWSHDSDGNPVRMAIDEGANGIEDEVTTYAYSDCLLRRAVLSIADGGIAKTWWRYDEEGTLTRIERDSNNDDMLDSIDTYTQVCPGDGPGAVADPLPAYSLDTGAGDSGDSGIDSGDSGADSGDSGADSGDSGADSGDSGVDSGDSGADSGDSGADSGDSGADSGDSGAGSSDSGASGADSGP